MRMMIVLILVTLWFGFGAADNLFGDQLIPCTGQGRGFMCVPGMGDDIWVLPTETESATLARKGYTAGGRRKRQTGTENPLSMFKELKDLITFTHSDEITDVIEDPKINQIDYAKFKANSHMRAFRIPLERLNPDGRGAKRNYLDRIQNMRGIDWLNKELLIDQLATCYYTSFAEGKDSEFKFEKGKPGYLRFYDFACSELGDSALVVYGVYHEDFTLEKLRTQIRGRDCTSFLFFSSCDSYVIDRYYDRTLTLQQRIEFEDYARKRLAITTAKEYRDKLPEHLRLN